MECISPWNRRLALSLPFLKPEGEQGGDCGDVFSLAVSLRAHGFMIEPGMFSFLVLSIFVTELRLANEGRLASFIMFPGNSILSCASVRLLCFRCLSTSD